MGVVRTRMSTNAPLGGGVAREPLRDKGRSSMGENAFDNIFVLKEIMYNAAQCRLLLGRAP